MTNLELAQNIIRKSHGVAKTADLIAAGLSKVNIKELIDNGTLLRVRHGFYQLEDDTGISEAQYLAILLPDGIVCVESALFHYGYSDFSPREWTLPYRDLFL